MCGENDSIAVDLAVLLLCNSVGADRNDTTGQDSNCMPVAQRLIERMSGGDVPLERQARLRHCIAMTESEAIHR